MVLDSEFSKWSVGLMEEFARGDRLPVISEVTMNELSKASKEVRSILDRVPGSRIIFALRTPEAEDLANKYISEGALDNKHKIDAMHIAIATVEHVDLLVSWNFRHIVNIERIHAFNAVNLKSGYGLLEIRSPRDVFRGEEEERI